MTLGKAAAGVVTPGKAVYNIGFHGNDHTSISACNVMDLLESWIDFCIENGIQTNSVDYVVLAAEDESQTILEAG